MGMLHRQTYKQWSSNSELWIFRISYITLIVLCIQLSPSILIIDYFHNSLNPQQKLFLNIPLQKIKTPSYYGRICSKIILQSFCKHLLFSLCWVWLGERTEWRKHHYIFDSLILTSYWVCCPLLFQNQHSCGDCDFLHNNYPWRFGYDTREDSWCMHMEFFGVPSGGDSETSSLHCRWIFSFSVSWSELNSKDSYNYIAKYIFISTLGMCNYA